MQPSTTPTSSAMAAGPAGHASGPAPITGAAPGTPLLLDRCAELGRTHLAPHAHAVDEAAALAAPALQALQVGGWLQLALLLPEESEGADLRAAVLVVAEMARHCTSTALVLAGHLAAALWCGPGLGARPTPPPVSGSDGGLCSLSLHDALDCAAGGSAHGVLARRVAGGYLLHGHKHLVPAATQCACHALLCTPDRPGATQDDTLLLRVPAHAAGLRVQGAWDALGLRGLGVRELVLEDVFVPDGDVLLPEGVYARAAARWPHMQLLVLAPALGLAQAACDHALQWLQGRAGSGAGPALRRDAITHQAVARMQLMLERTRAVFLQALQSAGPDPGVLQRQGLLAAHHAVLRDTQALCTLALQSGGAAALQRGAPLQRTLRDALTLATLLPWSADAALAQLGRACLDEGRETPPEADVW